MLDQLLAALATTIAALTVLAVCGLAPLRLLPVGLVPYRLFLLPALGLACYVVGAYWVSLVLPMDAGIWVILAVAVAVEGWFRRPWERGYFAYRNRPWPAGLFPHRPAAASSGLRRPLLSTASLRPGGEVGADHPGPLPEGQGEGAGTGHLSVAGLALLGFVFALLPLAGRPELLAIGPNWDTEVYLPLAEALRTFPNGFSLDHPAGTPFPADGNPLHWRLNFFDTRSGGLGFSLLQSGVGALTGLPAYRTYAPLLACLFALSIPGAWVLLRTTFGLGRGSALWAAALLSVNSAILYVVFLGFGQQVAAFVLLPASVCLGVTVLRGGEMRTAVLAGLLLAGLIGTYTPALPLYGAVIGTVGLAGILGARAPRQQRGMGRADEASAPPDGIVHPERSAAIILGVAFALFPLAAVRLGMRLSHFLAEGGTGGLTHGPDVRGFAPLAWALGVLPGPGVGAGWSVPLDLPWATPLVSVGLVGVMGCLAILGVLAGLSAPQHVTNQAESGESRRRPEGRAGNQDSEARPSGRRRMISESATLLLSAASVIALLALLRFGLVYPYGYFKLLPMAAVFLIAPAAAGLGSLRAFPHPDPLPKGDDPPLPLGEVARDRPTRPTAGEGRSRIVATIVGAGVLLVAAATSLATVLAARDNSTHSFSAAAALQEMVPTGASVCLDGGPGLEGPAAAAALLFLDHAEVFGFVRTGYGTMYRPASVGCDYALAPADDRPDPELYLWQQPAWEFSEGDSPGRGLGWQLARRSQEVLLFHDFGRLDEAPVIAGNPSPGHSGRLRIDRWGTDGNPVLSPKATRLGESGVEGPIIDAWSPPLLGVLSITAGPLVTYPDLGAEGIVLNVGRDRITLDGREGAQAAAGECRTFGLTVIAFEASHIALGPAAIVEVQMGVTTLSDVQISVPFGVRLRSDRPVLLKSMTLSPCPRPAPAMRPSPQAGVAALLASGSLEGAAARLDLRLAGGDGLSPVLDIYRDDGGAHFGWWRLPDLAGPGNSFVLDLEQQVAHTASGTPLAGETWPAGDGLFRGYLMLYREDGSIGKRLPLLSFRVAGGTVAEFALEHRGMVVR